MKLFLLTAFTVLCALTEASAQLLLGGSHAGFTVDADTRVGFSKYGPFTGTVYNNDDWFLPQSYDGTGIGIIDTTGAAVLKAKLQGSQNISFSKRMVAPMYSVNGGNLWLDGLYTRDYNVQYDALGNTNGKDSTGFTNSAKNASDPNINWQGGAASFPNKTELIDGFAHMRRAGTSITDSLWMFFAVSSLGVNGDRYFDIELFKKKCSFSSSTGLFTTSGAEGGHTSWKFDASGNVTETGDLIIACSYSPGSAPVLDIRIWVSSATFASVNPSRFNFSGVFDGVGSYGYAQIVSNSNSTAFGSGVGNYSAIAANDTTYATPWGTAGLSGGTNIWSQNYQRLQMVEVGINLTRIGVDAALYTGQGLNACTSAFYSVIFKSRSSSSFTANLQDFIGPLNFTTASITEYTLNADTLSCNKANANITITNPYGQGIYKWTTANGIINGSNTDSSVIQVSKAGNYILNMTPYVGCPPLRTDTIQVLADYNQPVATATATVDVYQNPYKIDLFGGSTAASNYLTAFGGSKGLLWDWSGPAGFTSSIQNPVNDTAWGTYTLIITEKRNGCKDTASVFIDAKILSTEEVVLTAKINDNKTTLEWTKVTGTDLYTIEKSNDGNIFHNIGTLTNAGNGQARFVDVNPDTRNFYRISYIMAGNRKFSNTVAATQTSANPVNIYKPLGTDFIRVTAPGKQNGDIRIVISNMAGQLIQQQEMKLNNESLDQTIRLSSRMSSSLLLASVYRNGQLVAVKKLL